MFYPSHNNEFCALVEIVPIRVATQDVEAAEAAVEEAREKLDSAETALPHGTSAPVSLEAGRRALDRALQACKEESREQYASQQAGALAPRQARYGPAKSPTTASIKELLASGTSDALVHLCFVRMDVCMLIGGQLVFWSPAPLSGVGTQSSYRHS